MHPDDDYLDGLKTGCISGCQTAVGLLDLPLELNRAHFIVRNLQHALSQAMAMENELRGVARPKVTE